MVLQLLSYRLSSRLTRRLSSKPSSAQDAAQQKLRKSFKGESSASSVTSRHRRTRLTSPAWLMRAARSFKGIPQHLWLTIVTIIFILYLVPHTILSIRPTHGPSMLPTIGLDGDRVLISYLYRRGRGIKVGNLVSFEHPVRKGTFATKRVIGMPGDFVLRDTPGKGCGSVVQVPQGHCWVAGDNLQWSRDSRHFGPLPLALVRGRVIAKIVPHFRLFDDGFTSPAEEQGND